MHDIDFLLDRKDHFYKSCAVLYYKGLTLRAESKVLICWSHLSWETLFKFLQSLYACAVLDWFCLDTAEFNAPVDVHDIATKPSPQLMVLGHGALSAFCPIIIQMSQ